MALCLGDKYRLGLKGSLVLGIGVVEEGVLVMLMGGQNRGQATPHLSFPPRVLSAQVHTSVLDPRPPLWFLYEDSCTVTTSLFSY